MWTTQEKYLETEYESNLNIFRTKALSKGSLKKFYQDSNFGRMLSVRLKDPALHDSPVHCTGTI